MKIKACFIGQTVSFRLYDDGSGEHLQLSVKRLLGVL